MTSCAGQIKNMFKNVRIPRYKTIIPDSDISDGTTPEYADSEARPERFLQKRTFLSDRADKILYFPSLTFGREDSDASRRFGTCDIEIYNQIKRLIILRVKTRISLQNKKRFCGRSYVGRTTSCNEAVGKSRSRRQTCRGFEFLSEICLISV